jgi:hypothetical protein
MTPAGDGLANHEIVTLAVYLLRGEVQEVDTEDAAIKAAEIAPGRFSWRKYPDQVNLDAVRKRLWDACRSDRGGYLAGSEREGWRLTEAGVRFASANIGRLGAQQERRPLSLRERRWRTRERERLMATDAYRDFSQGDVTAFGTRDAEKFFRIDEHVSRREREARVERAKVLFGDDAELGGLVALMAQVALQGGRGG